MNASWSERNDSLFLDPLVNITTITFTAWSLGDIFYICFDMSAILLGCLVLLLLYIDRGNKTSFKVYIANLCVVNIYYTALGFVTITNKRLVFPAEPPQAYCVILRFLNYITAGLVHLAHFLIAVNRVWAVTWPVSYRQYNRNNAIRNPVIICTGMWLYVHAFVVPAVILDSLVPKPFPELHQCILWLSWNAHWNIAAGVLVYHTPIAIMLAFYPFILYKTIKRSNRSGRNQVGQSGRATTEAVSRKSRARADAHSAQQSTHQSYSIANATVESQSKRPLRTFWKFLRQRASDGQFLTLSMLTLNVTVFLFPAQVYHVLLLANINPLGMQDVVDTMYTFSPTIDSLLFLFTVKSLRDTLRACTRRNSP
ncbi:hypothetical protein RvY_15222 [Ramazzottius varieornatus]|uniref:G-protein coupled receptors family 1 profile domain-containing protein n=1 Tax=Ramazzottius varieornatus TaxID=947166 RepID=A0A1D1W120_RAMVA|nr:hypothetical protein RvY_15222 [Ramazzottius varieornatus]